MKTVALVGKEILRALRRRGLSLPDPDVTTHEFGAPVLIPPRAVMQVVEEQRDRSGRVREISAVLGFDPCSKAPQRMPAQDIAGFDKRADREARWRTQGCLEMEKLIPFMKNAGVKPEIIEHAEEVLRDLQEQRRRKYPQKGLE